MLWRRRIEPFTRPFVYGWFRLARGLTLGVRGMVVDGEGRVLLIEHTYVPGWHMPGGGVERGETAETAVRRELLEEAGIVLTRPPTLLSVHDNNANHRGDHVLVFLCRDWEQVEATSRGEIHAVGWFAPDALPDGATKGTRARIREALEGGALDPLW
jgi:ADP-ribose pyrophosphatase YjhB (NUDIX family)